MARKFSEIIKDMTAASVHTPTALGNQKSKHKAKSFLSAIGDVEKRLTFQFAKADSEKRLVFGWASVATIYGEPVIDKQGDIIPPEELETAVYDYVLNCREQGDMHIDLAVGRLVESCIFTAEKQAALGIDLGKEGWWVGFYVDDDTTWDAIKRGERPEFSIGGSGTRTNMEVE